ncbi:carbon monoxide dehydrogenase [Metallosphaera tengchongensis]|uniref:Carbon monoxide dehydrogenase n=1 Tax=Metallosphaera tengchongensis TaxID=1532350 RepID=A0A6N0NZL6_9CREN|nr:SRPBCC domain-containing protein [Metallosphaera tengchongensis]QKR00520.1 carbon monoxide dehydrogenase [Metallosphaera tengchongensis]
MTKLSGQERIKEKKTALSFFSDYKNLLQCVPGIKQINGKKFVIEASLGPLRAELTGEVKSYEFEGDVVKNLLEVQGPGLVVAIRTEVRLGENSLEWTADYTMEGSLAKALSNTISKQAEEVSRRIISCSISKINQS